MNKFIKYLKSVLKLAVRSPHEWAIIFRMALRNLKMNKLRTGLTVLGIIIGIMSVIIVMAGGAALENYVFGYVSAFGSDYIQVEVKVPGTSATSFENAAGRAGGVAITTLKEADGKAVARLPNVDAWNAGTIDLELATYQDVKKRVVLYGNRATVPQIDRQIVLGEGSFYSDTDDSGAANVIVIGSGVKDTFFGEEDPLEKNIKIKGVNYRVIGVVKSRGAGGFLNFDDFIYIPVNTLNKKILGIDYYQFITFKVKDVSRIEETALDVRDVMRLQHHITDPDKEDFSVMTALEGLQIVSRVTNTINYLLLALTSISLVVGGVGIMNVMYVAVTERTREIGLRKALGATNSAILRQFLLEAVMVTLLGGIIGIILGILLTYLLGRFLIQAGFNLSFTIPLQSIVVASIFAVLTGLIFGIYPAHKASQLSPLEALRHE